MQGGEDHLLTCFPVSLQSWTHIPVESVAQHGNIGILYAVGGATFRSAYKPVKKYSSTQVVTFVYTTHHPQVLILSLACNPLHNFLSRFLHLRLLPFQQINAHIFVHLHSFPRSKINIHNICSSSTTRSRNCAQWPSILRRMDLELDMNQPKSRTDGEQRRFQTVQLHGATRRSSGSSLSRSVFSPSFQQSTQ